MILEMSAPNPRLLFVASNLEDRQEAEYEIVDWARAHGYRMALAERSFIIHRQGLPDREWHLVERVAA